MSLPLFLFLLRFAVSTCEWQMIDIPRIKAEEVSVSEFWDKWSEIPVIITGVSEPLVQQMSWSNVAAMCPDAEIHEMGYREDSDEWAKLNFHQMGKISDFFRYTLEQADQQPEHRLLYGFDMILSKECPRFFDVFKFPRYFSECLLQQDDTKREFVQATGNDATFAWPTLMVGPNRTRSSLHTDNNGLPFWMVLLQGRKHWRVLPYKANQHLAGPHPTWQFDPPAYGDEFKGELLYTVKRGAAFEFDAFAPDFQAFPELCRAVAYDGVLEAGEIMYIPNSAPHGVVNKAHTLAITANLFHPMDKAQARWMEKNCERTDENPSDLGFTPAVCSWFRSRIAKRKIELPPQEEIYLSEFMDNLNDYPLGTTPRSFLYEDASKKGQSDQQEAEHVPSEPSHQEL